MDNNKIRQSIKSNHWTQGSCLFVKKSSPLISKDIVKKTGLYVVISQSCDILHDSLEDDPNIELLFLEKIDSIDGHYKFGKNPRKIDISVKHKNGKLYYRGKIKNKVLISKNYLEHIAPSNDFAIDEKTQANLIYWIVKRYNRAALPDSCEKRLAKSKKKIKNLLKPHVNDIYGIFIKVFPESELSDDENYEITLRIVFTDEITDNNRKKIEDLQEELVETLKQIEGITIENDFRTTSIYDISYGEILDLDNWDYEYLSYY